MNLPSTRWTCEMVARVWRAVSSGMNIWLLLTTNVIWPTESGELGQLGKASTSGVSRLICRCHDLIYRWQYRFHVLWFDFYVPWEEGAGNRVVEEESNKVARQSEAFYPFHRGHQKTHSKPFIRANGHNMTITFSKPFIRVRLNI